MALVLMTKPGERLSLRNRIQPCARSKARMAAFHRITVFDKYKN